MAQLFYTGQCGTQGACRDQLCSAVQPLLKEGREGRRTEGQYGGQGGKEN